MWLRHGCRLLESARVLLSGGLHSGHIYSWSLTHTNQSKLTHLHCLFYPINLIRIFFSSICFSSFTKYHPVNPPILLYLFWHKSWACTSSHQFYWCVWICHPNIGLSSQKFSVVFILIFTIVGLMLFFSLVLYQQLPHYYCYISHTTMKTTAYCITEASITTTHKWSILTCTI